MGGAGDIARLLACRGASNASIAGRSQTSMSITIVRHTLFCAVVFSAATSLRLTLQSLVNLGKLLVGFSAIPAKLTDRCSPLQDRMPNPIASR